MSRPLSAPMLAHLAKTSHTRATMLLIERRDGVSLGMTDHDVDLEFDLGDGAVTYEAGIGILPSNLELTIGLEPDNFEVRGPIGDTVTLAQVLGGRFNSARVWLFQVNWRDLSQGAIPLLAGSINQARVEGGAFVFEGASDAARFAQPVLEIITPQCRTYYGSPLCGATPESVVGTVTAVTDEMAFTVSYPGSFADDYFNAGTVEPLTGDLVGSGPVEIHDWTVAGAIVLFVGLLAPPEVGDTFTIRRGCPRSRTACMERGQILNFRGEPELPGSDQVLRPTIPGQGND